MNERDNDSKQLDAHDDQLLDIQKIAKWIGEVEEGQLAQMNILKYLSKREGSLIDEVTQSTGESVTSRGVLDLGLVHNRLPDKQPLSEQSSNKSEPQSSNHSLVLSKPLQHEIPTVERFAASQPQTPDRVGSYKSKKTSSISRNRKVNPLAGVRSRSYAI